MIADLLNHPHVIKIVFLSLSGAIIRQSLVVSGQRWANTYHHLKLYSTSKYCADNYINYKR